MKKYLLIALCLLMIPFGATVFLIIYLNSVHSYSRTINNQEIIVKAYLKYIAENNENPTSLEDLVHGNYLPEYGSFYKEPRSIFGRDSYKDSNYLIVRFEDKEINAPKVIGELINRKGKSTLVFLPEVNSIIRQGMIEMGRIPKR